MAGTKVVTEHGFRPIEEISVGDRVLSFDEASRVVTFQRVERALRSIRDEILVLHFGDGQVSCTPRHRFYKGDWIAAGKLQSGDRVLDRDGRERQVERVESVLGRHTVFNLHVENCMSYFVGDELGLLVHSVKEEGNPEDVPVVRGSESDEAELRRRLRGQAP